MIEKSLAIQREITPAIWQMIGGIVESAAGVSKMKQAEYARKILFAYENDLPLSAGISGGIFVVNEKIEVEGIIWRSKIKQHPTYDYKIEELTTTSCTMIGYDNGVEIGRITYDEDDAATAKLLGKDNWEKHPKDMYLNKASARLGRYFMPDLFNMPVYVRGEISGQYDNSVVIDGDMAIPTMQELIEEFGHNLVLSAINSVGDDLLEIQKWLEENDD